MVNTYLHDLRCLAINSQISYSSHAVDQMLSRNIGRRPSKLFCPARLIS